MRESGKRVLFFKLRGELLPLRGALSKLRAEVVEQRGLAAGVFGADEVHERGFGGGDGGFEARDLLFHERISLVQLAEFDGIEAAGAGRFYPIFRGVFVVILW